eukprot:1784115-Prymnesium_polylepis.1
MQCIEALASLRIDPKVDAHQGLVHVVRLCSGRILVKEFVQSIGNCAGCIVVVLRGRHLPPAAKVERLAIELHTSLCLTVGDAEDSARSTTVATLEEPARQQLREPSSHGIACDICAPAAPVHTAATNLVDGGDKVLGRLQQQRLRLSVGGSALPLLKLWRQQQLDLWGLDEAAQHLACE